MATRSHLRRIQSRVNATTIRFETLEDRNMLAADWGIADPFASSLITHISNDVPVIQQMDVLRAHLNAGDTDTFELINHDADSLGFDHYKFQHFQNGLPVESSVYTVHARGGLIVSLSGEYHEVANATTTPAISEKAALNSALDFVSAKLYAWQDADFKDAFGDLDDHGHSINFELPEGELVYSQGQLAYKFDIYATQPTSRAWVFVNAGNGQVIETQDLIHDIDVPASGSTLYDATRTFTADFNLTEYRLREAGGATAPAVETFTLNESTVYADAVDFVSTSANFSDPGHDLGNQTHWGTEQTWDYFFTQHGRDSYDDAGSPLRSYVSFGVNYSNAFWNGSFMTYGDGNGVTRGPLVSLDIVGHEIGHGVTGNSAGLIYQNHSGALNESFSDIFGESVENHARGSNDWILGGDIGLNGNSGQIRNMADPNLFNHPDTYLGDYWYVGNGDNGGVHLNSGVQNKWFYIMVNGEAGTNDTGHTYNVTGMGMVDAGAIAYRNLNQYLTPNSTYPDARVGAIRAAIDLFGAGSVQHISTMQSWDAVGVYGPVAEFDLYPVNPRGSQIFAANSIGEVAFETDKIEFEVGLDANQLLTLTVVNESGALLPTVTIEDSAGLVMASATAASTIEILHFDSLPIVFADVYTITIEGDLGTIGLFKADLLLNAGLEGETIGLTSNDIFVNADFIGQTSLTQGHIPTSLVDRLAVLGELDSGSSTTGGGDGFESGTLDPMVWQTFSSTPNGRIEIASDTGTPFGTNALAMDVDTAGVFNLNEAIMTVDLTDVTDLDLSFSHVSFSDENHLLPPVFSGSFAGDGVSVSDDGIVWYTVWSEFSFSNNWADVVIDLDEVVDSTPLSFGPDFQIKFQQYDNFPRTSDGRAYDNILVGGDVDDDWYTFEVQPGESVTLLATQVGADTGIIEMEVFDSTETLIASSVPAVDTPDAYVQTLVNSGITPEFYSVRVFGNSSQYTLVATRGGTFDLEDGFDQDITGLQGVLGYTSGSVEVFAEPDELVAATIANASFTGVTLVNNFDGGDIYAVEATTFLAPTGIHVFGPTDTGESGFRDGINEFRADFDNLQQFVSIDVGSDDTLDVAYLRAYDASDNLLQEVIGAGAAINQVETLFIQRPFADISYVVAAGFGSHTAPLDNLVFQEDAIDSDVYITSALTGDTIEFRAYLPGGGPLEFENRLNEIAGIQIGMALVDPVGTTVDTAFFGDVIEHIAEMDGDYELIVFATAFDGEYYVTRDTGIVYVTVDAAKFLDGSTAGGSLSDSYFNDSFIWQLATSPTANPVKQIIDVIALGVSPVTNPVSLGFRLEANMIGGPPGDVIQTVQLWDYSTNAWEVIDTRAVTNTLVTVDMSTTGNPDRFVQSVNSEIIARVTFESIAFAGTPFFWSVQVDQMVWRVGQY